MKESLKFSGRNLIVVKRELRGGVAMQASWLKDEFHPADIAYAL